MVGRWITWVAWVLAVATPALLCGVSHYAGDKAGAARVQAEWDTEKAVIVTAQRDKEAALQSNMDKLRTEKNNELARLNRHVRSLSDSLRNRPERPSSPALPASASSGSGATGCTGSGLYRSDSEFLIWESSRANQIRLALKECYAAYGAASGKQPE